jgi:ribokinase
VFKGCEQVNKILVIGSLNMDLVIATARVPVMGETILGNGFMTVAGGKGANQAVAAAKLGGRVTMAGCVGNDVFGRELTNNLQCNQVDTKYIRTVDGVSTGIAVVVVKEGNNFIIVDPGANYQVTTGSIAELENVIKDSSFLVLQLEIPLETVEAAIQIAKQYHVKVVLNPAPAVELTEELLNKVDILILNETESQIITGIDVNEIGDAAKVIDYIRNIGVKQVVVTLGGNGAVYNREDAIVHLPVPIVETVDTTAAGDSFIGAMVAALSQGKNIDKAIHYANIVGTLTVTRKGAQISLPDQREVEVFLTKNNKLSPNEILLRVGKNLKFQTDEDAANA